MNTRILSTLFFIIMLSVSCKKTATEETTPIVDEVEAPDVNSFKVSFDLIAEADDDFHLYFTEDGTTNFTEAQSVWLPIKGNAAQQTITFVLPESAQPTCIRIDFGKGGKSIQKDIVLQKFAMNFYDKKFEAQGAQIFNYFYPNEVSTEVDIANATIKRKGANSEAPPSLYPHIALNDEIKKMF